MEQGGHSKVMPALDPSTSALNRKQHTEAERQEPSNDTRAASAFTSKRPKRSQTSSITKKENPTGRMPGRVFHIAPLGARSGV